jgi:hypothetical protein
MARGDLLTRAAAGLVLLVGVLAVADSVRGCDTTMTEVGPPPTTTQATVSTTTTDEGPTPQPEAPTDWPQGALDGVLTFVGADDCRIRTIGLAGGRERPATRFVTDCRGFWAPKVGTRLAFGELPDGGFFRIADLGHPRRDLGSFPTSPPTRPIWSFDGQRIAWCDSPDTGVEREILGGGRILPFCPLAYTPQGELVEAEGRRLVLGSETLLETAGPLDFAQFAPDGSVVVLLGGRLQRYAGEGSEPSVRLPVTWTGEPPVPSPDGCAAAVSTEEGIAVLPLGCGYSDFFTFPGHAATWSPDAHWLAVAEADRIVFHRMTGGAGETLTWPVSSVQLAWRSD